MNERHVWPEPNGNSCRLKTSCETDSRERLEYRTGELPREQQPQGSERVALSAGCNWAVRQSQQGPPPTTQGAGVVFQSRPALRLESRTLLSSALNVLQIRAMSKKRTPHPNRSAPEGNFWGEPAGGVSCQPSRQLGRRSSVLGEDPGDTWRYQQQTTQETPCGHS